jgi:hypothetical protein
VILLFSSFAASSQAQQNTPTKEASFCGKVGDGVKGGAYTVKELKNCDWKIVPQDSNLTVVEFQMSLVPKNNAYEYTEKKITGNAIPGEYKNQILGQTKNVFLEYIEAVNRQGQQELIKPIAMRIQ